MRPTRRLVLLVAAACLCLPPSLHAETESAIEGKACREDVVRFCADIKSIDKSIAGECVQILKAHMRFLTPACRKVIETDRVSG